MTIATATATEIRVAYDEAYKLTKLLQPYVQGNADTTKGTKGYATVAQIDTQVTAVKAAIADIAVTAPGG